MLKSQEVDLWHVRPLQLAREWQRPPIETIELCLQAVRAGLLELRWDVAAREDPCIDGVMEGLDLTADVGFAGRE